MKVARSNWGKVSSLFTTLMPLALGLECDSSLILQLGGLTSFLFINLPVVSALGLSES